MRKQRNPVFLLWGISLLTWDSSVDEERLALKVGRKKRKREGEEEEKKGKRKELAPV